jgi:hypothetical protein
MTESKQEFAAALTNLARALEDDPVGMIIGGMAVDLQRTIR